MGKCLADKEPESTNWENRMEKEKRKNRVDWLMEDRFGMFIHWGLYSLQGRGEWCLSDNRQPLSQYKQYFEQFNPIAYDPKAWARLAKQAGMKYVVLTAKHHDGFCLFDSQYTDYKATNTKAGRDLIREYVEAVRGEGLKIGLYYSLLDWHHPDYRKYDDLFHPMRGKEEYKEDSYDWDRYLTYMHNQVRELCTNYGKVDLLWFDFSYGDRKGEVWKASELMKMVRELQPDVLVDNRLEGGGSSNGTILDEVPSPICGDFASPEQSMPITSMRNKAGRRVPWELCTTINNSWGYTPSDTEYKSSEFLIRKLVECVSKGGNMILNVSPDAYGNIPIEQAEILKEMGLWMEKNHESIYGCTEAELPRPQWGRYTRKGDILYGHIMELPVGPVPITDVPKERIKNIRLLYDGRCPLDATSGMGPRRQPEIQFISLGVNPNHTYPLPVKADTVIRIELSED